MVELGIERHRVHRLRRQRGIRGLGVVVDLLIARRDDEGADLQILRRLVDDLDLAVVVPRQVRKCDRVHIQRRHDHAAIKAVYVAWSSW